MNQAQLERIQKQLQKLKHATTETDGVQKGLFNDNERRWLDDLFAFTIKKDGRKINYKELEETVKCSRKNVQTIRDTLEAYYKTKEGKTDPTEIFIELGDYAIRGRDRSSGLKEPQESPSDSNPPPEQSTALSPSGHREEESEQRPTDPDEQPLHLPIAPAAAKVIETPSSVETHLTTEKSLFRVASAFSAVLLVLVVLFVIFEPTVEIISIDNHLLSQQPPSLIPVGQFAEVLCKRSGLWFLGFEWNLAVEEIDADTNIVWLWDIVPKNNLPSKIRFGDDKPSSVGKKFRVYATRSWWGYPPGQRTDVSRTSPKSNYGLVVRH